MKLPLSWLKKFVTVEAGLDELCQRLTVAGLEVENIEKIDPSFTDVFVAKVIGVERHPNADRLSLCDVDAGPAGRFRVVCGAPNVYAGMTGALAKVGARLAGGVHGGGSGSLEDAVPLEAATIRGVHSEGMLCSELELGMSKDHQGILELPSGLKLGEPLADYLEIPDTVLDIAITPNRGDCLSILGLAREIAALFNAKLKLPRIRPAKAAVEAGVDGWEPVAVEIRAPELCPRYAALPLSHVKVGPSPVWLRRRLELCGMRALNNIVDITNYVMLELGQPLHAFDAAKIADHAIVVRHADEDRAFDTLDGTRRALNPNDLLIADREKPLAIAGVMGGQNSEVGAETSALILESAYFEPSAIARTARRMGLRSEASYRFERGIDRAGQVNAILRAGELIRQLAGGRLVSTILDVEPRPAQPRQIELDPAAMASILGVSILPVEVKRRLRAIGASVENAGRGKLKVTAPSFRPDINETAALAEEVARLAGLAEIPAIPPVRTTLVAPPDTSRALAHKVREILIGCGLVEAKTIGFVAPADNQQFRGLITVEPLRVANPLSSELSEMRLSLLPGLLTALRFNLNREATAFHMFELGKVFGLQNGVASEFERVAAVSYGDYAMGAIGRPAAQAGFASIKGIIEACLRTLALGGRVTFEPIADSLAPHLHPGRAALIRSEGELLGVTGELHPHQMLRLDLTSPCVLFELDMTRVRAHASQSRPTIVAPPRFPAIRRDLALLVDRDLLAERVTETITALAISLLESVELFDVYQGDSLPAGKKSIAVACRYRRKDRTLTDDEVNRAHAALVEQVAARLGADLRQ
jgi:phenylalanyl-tRNA synthetase beta chain